MQGGQPIQSASRALTDTEKRYSQIEKEMLSIVFGLTRFHSGAPRAKRACKARWVNKSTHPKKIW